MKRKVLIPLFLSLTQFAFAQMTSTAISASSKIAVNDHKVKCSIVDDRINESSERIVCSSFRKLNANAPEPVGLSLGVVGLAVGDSARLNLNMFLSRSLKSVSVPKGSYVLFKLADGTTMKKTIEYSYEPIPVATSMFGSVFNMYYCNVALHLSDDELSTLLLGFSKIRLEVNSNVFDFTVKKDNITEFLAESYKLVNSKLLQKKSFDDDF